MMDFYGPRGFFAEHIELDSDSQSESHCEGRGLSNIAFVGLNYSATIWPFGLMFLGKHLDIISSYCAKFYVSSSLQLTAV